MTAYQTYLQDDFELRDNIQTISITNRVTSVTISGVKAFTRRLNYREESLGERLGYLSTDSVFVIGSKRLYGAVPNQGDTIIDADGVKWTILSQVESSFGDTPIYYETIARKQV